MNRIALTLLMFAATTCVSATTTQAQEFLPSPLPSHAAPFPDAGPSLYSAPNRYFAPSVGVRSSLAGVWSGSWKSCTTNHKGPMSATFCPVGPGCYEVHFRGRFFKLIPFKYTATLRVVGYEGERVLLEGSHRLGPLMGTFHYRAWADAHHFVATYSSKRDHGQFIMSRVK